MDEMQLQQLGTPLTLLLLLAFFGGTFLLLFFVFLRRL